GCINVTGLKISNKYFSEYCNFNLIGFSSSLPNINTSIDISNIDNLSQLSAQQFITNYLDTPTKINNWLSQYRNLIIVDSSEYPGVNISIKSNTNPSINSNNNSINLTIVVSFNNLSEELNLAINGFRSIINLPTLKSNIDVSSIDSSYAQLTADDFKKKYFNDEISINLWLKNHKSYLFNENINDDSLEIVLSPNTNVNVVNTTIELNVNISNIDNLPTTGKLVLSNFKPNPIVIPLPTLKNNIDISLINSNYLDIEMSKFVENNFANEQNINNWLSKYKNYFFNSSNLNLTQISLQIEPNSLLEASHSRDALSFNVVFSNGIDSQNDKLTLTNFKSLTPPVTNPISPIPYSYTPHLDTQLPRIDISINTNDPNNITNQYQSANFIVTDPNTNNVSPTLSGKIKVRGNSTSVYPKKPYRIKLDKKTSMLNLNYNNEFKDWVLLADWRDPSMLRNATGLYLGQFLYKDFGLYSSDFRQIEVYINNTYQGMYLLCEQNEVSTNRVNINKPILNSSNLDIGYLLEMDAYADSEEPLFRFDLNYNNKAKLPPEDNPDKNIFQSLGVLSYSIKSKIYSNEQNKFISNYLENIYRICYKAIIENKYYEFNNDKTDIIESNNIKTTDECISRVLDIDSVVASLILQEIVCDWDLSNSSFYMSVDLSQFGDGKLKLQVPWDFDCAFGIRYPWNGTFIVQPKGLYAANSSNPWMVLLYKSKLIQTKIKDKWAEMISNNVFEKLIKYLDDCSTLYSQNYEINFNKWKNIGEYARQEYLKYSQLETTSYSPPELEYWNAVAGADIVPEATWKNVVSQLDAKNYLKDWLKTRLTNLNNLWKK
ncbi:MAG: CotH kinase family protein, partial [Ureaplasma sp.]|nr:CotH kinase family protein [Ureaplasma sp.]